MPFSVKIEKGHLVISLPLKETPKTSGSGKNFTIASTDGIINSGLQFEGKDVKLGVNAFVKNENYVKP